MDFSPSGGSECVPADGGGSGGGGGKGGGGVKRQDAEKCLELVEENCGM